MNIYTTKNHRTLRLPQNSAPAHLSTEPSNTALTIWLNVESRGIFNLEKSADYVTWRSVDLWAKAAPS